MAYENSSGSRLRHSIQHMLPGVLLITLLMAGALVGAWGAPRAVILAAPHAPKVLVYGSVVVGILAGAAAGVAAAEVLARACQRVFGLEFDK